MLPMRQGSGWRTGQRIQGNAGLAGRNAIRLVIAGEKLSTTSRRPLFQLKVAVRRHLLVDIEKLLVERISVDQMLFHLDHRLLGISPGTVGILLRWKIGLKDRLQHQHRCRHADPIPHGRDAQWPEFAIGLRYVHSS